MFVDGTPGDQGSRADILLISSHGDELTYAMRFSFKTTNNESKYKTLLTGLRLAQKLQVKNLVVSSY